MKTLQILSPDPKSMKQAILIIQHQLYCWLKSDIREIEKIDMENYGGVIDRENATVTPVCF